jgi:LPS-assembly lipoprotein
MRRAVPPTRPARRALLTGAGACGALAGCGFKLRGQTALPFRTFHSSLPPSSLLGGELRRAVRANGATIVDRRDDGQARFDLLGEALEREITALSTAGRPREFQLRYRIRWQVKGTAERELIAPSEMVLRRAIAVLDLQGIVNPEEEALLYRDMRLDAVQQILRRLSTIKDVAP